MYLSSFYGMHVVWWIFWLMVTLSVLLFAPPRSRRRLRRYEHPLAILQRRYALGELSSAEYEERKGRIARDLSLSHSSGVSRDLRSSP